MHKADLSALPCSIARSLQVVGEWWTMLVLRDLCFGCNRFDEIAEHLGIARNILKARLDSLIDSGMAYRHQYSERPERHEYLPTEKGLDFVPVLLSIAAWGDRWTAQGSPPMLITHLTCGHDTTATVVCSACAAPLGRDDIDVRPAGMPE
jgi:DNA-binding HxlR family transcriptional regulator